MKTKSRSKSLLLIVISSLAVLMVTLAVVQIYQSSTITYEDAFGETKIVFAGGLFDRGSEKYEDSEIFAETYKRAIYDITRMCVIKNQMETGGSFDADKAININAYANRTKNSYRMYASENDEGTGHSVTDNYMSDVNVEYKLDDLIKWGNYGFDLISVTGTEAQLDAYFYSLINGVDVPASITESQSEHYSAATAFDILSDLYADPGEIAVTTEYVLVERYRSMDKSQLLDHVNNRLEYRALVKNLISSASDLCNNYNEYIEYGDRYRDGNTNVLYCYQLNDRSGKSVRYSNLDRSVAGLTNDELSKEFTGHIKYVCFNPDRLQTATNIDAVNSVFMKSVIGEYEYSFGDGSRVWLAIDEEYPADDIFSAVKSEYNKTNAMLIPALIAAATGVIIYIILFVIMTILAGRVVVTDENGEKREEIRASKIDTMPFEVYLLLVAAAVGLLGGMCATIYWESDSLIRHGFDRNAFYPIWGTALVLCNIILLPLYLILVRKIKCKLMWKGSILKWLTDKIHAGVTDMYDNGQLAVRIWLPFLLFLAFNLVLVLLGVAGIIVAFVADMFVGWLLYRDARTRNGIVGGINRISEGEISHKVDTKGMHGDNLALANAVNNIGDGISKAVDTSMRDEKMKADLITNVSHDIKTPLTSIINYVDLLKREQIEDERIRGYVDILDQKSQRLKQLTDDLVEASKISSGSISLNIEKLNVVELIHQSLGEFFEKFEQKGLKTILDLPSQPAYIMADSRGIFRVVENLFNNVYKYALEGTRVYVDMETTGDGSDEAVKSRVLISVKNISADPLNISTDELVERFTRGDQSRRTEGSGLGLSIAKSLTEAMGGTFDIALDGDLFKIVLGFDKA